MVLTCFVLPLILFYDPLELLEDLENVCLVAVAGLTLLGRRGWSQPLGSFLRPHLAKLALLGAAIHLSIFLCMISHARELCTKTIIILKLKDNNYR